DMESNVREVAVASGIEELKRRLEVLLGARAHAAVDETEKQRQQQEAERLARSSRVAEAGGQLVAAAFAFLGEMIPQRQPTNGAEQKASEFKARLDECLERDEQGRPRLTVTLPNEAALESLARSLAALFTVTETCPSYCRQTRDDGSFPRTGGRSYNWLRWQRLRGIGLLFPLRARIRSEISF